LAVAISLMLCIAIAALWVRSRVRQDIIVLYGCGEGGRTYYAIASGNGRVAIEKRVRSGGLPDLPRRVVRATEAANEPYIVSGWGYGGRFWWQRMGLASFERTIPAPVGGFPEQRRIGTGPYALACLVLAVLPALWLSALACRTPSQRDTRRAVVLGLLILLVTGSFADAYLAPPSWGWQPRGWALAALIGACVGVIWWRRIHFRNVLRDRREHGFCANCGFDLRATPSRCPECGACPNDAAPAAG
jgi:hypothetical protein